MLAVSSSISTLQNQIDTVLVFSQRLVECSLGNAPEYAPRDASEQHLRVDLADRAMVCASIPERSRDNLQNLMWRNVGITRNGTRLLLSARILNLWQRTMPAPETADDYVLRNMLTVARLIVESALARRESRGAHYRSDFPDTTGDWQRHIVLGRARSRT